MEYAISAHTRKHSEVIAWARTQVLDLNRHEHTNLAQHVIFMHISDASQSHTPLDVHLWTLHPEASDMLVAVR